MMMMNDFFYIFGKGGFLFGVHFFKGLRTEKKGV